MKAVQHWFSHLNEKNAKKLHLLNLKHLRKMNKTQFQNIRRFSLTTLQLQNYNLNVTSCGIIKSSFPDISELDRRVTIDKYIWQNVDNWKNHIAIVSNFNQNLF